MPFLIVLNTILLFQIDPIPSFCLLSDLQRLMDSAMEFDSSESNSEVSLIIYA